MVRLAGLQTKYTMLVVGTQSHSRCEGPAKTHLQDSGLLLNPQSKEQGLSRAGFHYTPPPLNASTGMLSSPMIYHTRMCGSSLFS